MKKEFDTIRLKKINIFQRLLSMALSLLMVFSLFGTKPASVIIAAENIQQETQTETRAETKVRLMEQIRYEGRDPYSTDMTLEEFYALMELFDEGKLPIDSAAKSILRAPAMEEPYIEGDVNLSVIPRTLFMVSGLPDADSITYQDGDAPLPYYNEGSDTHPNYPANLDPYDLGYQIPPTSWAGVPLGNGKSQVIIAPEGQNDDNNSVAGNVVQELFKDYSGYGYYVRRVTAENNEATVLGAIKLPGQDNYVYYYLTDEKQSTDVSTTMLADGKKFIIEYYSTEHLVEYEVRMDDLGGEDITAEQADVNVLGTDMTDTWENIIFGASHPNKTDNSAYSFTAYAPYGYTVELYLEKTLDEEPGAGSSEDSKWGAPSPLLGNAAPGSFDAVNGGWALGKEPDYFNGTANKATILPNTDNGPPTLTVSGNIYNNEVHHDRKLIAVVHKNEDPKFLVAPLKHNTANVSDRGTSANTQVRTADGELVDYDYEDVYLWANGGASKYQYKENDPTISSAGKSNLAKGNVPTVDSWQWQNKAPYNAKVDMNKEADGTYSYQWTWQTNTNSGGFTLDALEINGVAVTIPFFPKQSIVDAFKKGTNGGSTSWYTEADIGNGIHIKVEFMMIFNGSPPQRVYRITATGARSNVTISAMNLIMGTGAPEFVAYQLTGVTDGADNVSKVEYYIKQSNDPASQWRQAQQGSIYVDTTENGENVGINYSGDSNTYGANIRFKMADGYANPYYLWESMQTADIIQNQASVRRDKTTGDVNFDTMEPVKQLPDKAETLESQYIYGPDDEGWYYIKVTTQGDYKVALLTIGAKQVRYVVRYMPSIQDVTDPTGMPTFDHTGEADFDISAQYAEQYDTANGNYYDVTVDSIIRLPDATPSDPTSKFKFVDWVLVDIDGNPIEQDGKQFHYSVTHINLIDVIDHAVPNNNLGGVAADVYVLRLMPTWSEIQNPFHYNIALNWVDAQGKLHAEYFSENWKEVLTDWSIDVSGNLTIQVIQNSTPFLDWIAAHPTYIFWDEVNTNNALYQYYEEHDINASEATEEQQAAAYNAMSAEMAKAINTYLPSLTAEGMEEQYGEVLKALCTRDISGIGADGNPVKSGDRNGTEDFWRLGNYAYQVFEDYATIVVWMREEKGALAFRKNVQEEALIPNDEFYFSVDQVTTVFGTMLNGTYKAYPEKVYDGDGNERARTDSDAWVVTFVNGNVTSIIKNDNLPHTPTTYFTLKNGEGIDLYVPAGEYTISELGSKSGGKYRVEVTYDGESPAPTLSSGWMLSDKNGSSILKGSEKTFCTHKGDHASHSDTSQVSASVRFEFGEANMVHTLQFNNKTAALSIEKQLDATDENQEEFQKWLAANRNKMFQFDVTLTLPKGYEPFKDSAGNYYFNLKDHNAGVSDGQTKLYVTKQDDGVTWIGRIGLSSGQRAVVVMETPDDGKTLYADCFQESEEGPVTGIVPIPIENRDDITAMPNSNTPVYAETDENGSTIYYRLFYLSDENADPTDTKYRVYIDSFDQIRTEKRYVGEPTLSHDGEKLYYKIGSSYAELPTLLSEVNLKLAISNNVFQVCEGADVPLYCQTVDGEYMPIENLNKLKDLVNDNSDIYCKVGDSYYEITLTKAEDERYPDGYTFDGVYNGIYEEKIMQRLKINFPVYYSSDNVSYSPVLSLNEIRIQVDTIDVPVSNEIIEYRFDEIWTDPKDEEIFNEVWVRQSGITETGKRIDAVIVNWYKNSPKEGYLAITQTGGAPNESFLYRITNKETGESLIVSVKGGGVTYVCAPCGEYTVEEITDWAWRYEDGECVDPDTGTYIANVTISPLNNKPETAVHADYTNKHNDKVWLGGENSKNNHFGIPSSPDEEQETNSRKSEYTIPTAAYDDRKKKRAESDNQ